MNQPILLLLFSLFYLVSRALKALQIDQHLDVLYFALLNALLFD